MSSRYLIGIDLGTTNCAVAFAEPAAGAAVRDFPIPQLLRPGEVAELPVLPSCLYAAGEHELAPGATQLPWGESPKLIAGAFARWQGARVPGRLVVSAKSWLCHAGVDRASAILPWGAPADVPKVSPVAAAARLLGHIAAAWNHAHPEAPLAEQEVVITVPASFDEVARALRARRAAGGIGKVPLVEEPQAAFYEFISRHRQDLAAALAGVRLVLVVDVGGGTTDFTLIQVDASAGEPVLRRLAVGDHLMLGGDNMDAALARLAEERMLSGGRKFSATQWSQLLQAAREAKESLLGGAGRRNGTASRWRPKAAGCWAPRVSTEFPRAEVERAVAGWFFPGLRPRGNPAPRRPDRASGTGFALRDGCRHHASSGGVSAAARRGRLSRAGPAPPAACRVRMRFC